MNRYLLPRRMCQQGTERFVDSKGNNGLKDTVVVEKALPSSTGSLVDNWKERRSWQGSMSLRDKSADHGLDQGSSNPGDSRCNSIGRKHCSWDKHKGQERRCWQGSMSLRDKSAERRSWQGSMSLRDKSADHGLDQGSSNRGDSRCNSIGRKHCSWEKYTLCTHR